MDTTAHVHGRPGEGRIVISTLKRNDRDHCAHFPANYTTAVSLAGGASAVLGPYPEICEEDEVPIPDDVLLRLKVDPDDSGLLDGASGLLLPGGGDVHPARYGQDPHPRTHNVNELRDELEFSLLRDALARDMPVLAICRGMQVLNVFLGGTLEQHLGDEPGRLEHDRERPRAEAAHELRLKEGSRIARVIGSDRLPINSHHHQGLGRVASELEEVGWSEDGVLEAVESKVHTWVLGVQWHPEAMAPLDSCQLAIFRAFVGATKTYARRNASLTARSA